MSQVESCAETWDVAVVGAGPAGQTAGLYAARAGLRTVVFGDRYESQLARADMVENYPAQITPLSGLELIELLAQHAGKFGAQGDEQEIRQIRRDGEVFHLFSAGGVCHPAYAIVLAMGIKRKQLGVPGEEQYQGRGVAYCTICDGPLFRNMPVAVVGGGEEGAMSALRMSEIASSVDFLVPEPAMGVEEALEKQVRAAPHTTVITGVKVEEVLGDASGVTGVRFRAGGQAQTRSLRGVFMTIGVMPVSTLAVELGVEVTPDQFVRTGKQQETNVPGIFAAGDITGHKARQTVISAGEGATAAVCAVDYIKAHNLGGNRAGLRTIQWGATPARPAAAEPKAAPAPAPTARKGLLLDYVKAEKAYAAGFKAYKPDAATLSRLGAARPHARVTVVAASWCPDCRREVPRLARIAELLPGWEFGVAALDSDEARALGVLAVPTLVVFDAETGRELGRIVEEPRSGSWEKDLLKVAGA